MAKIQAVIFDIGNVLIEWQPERYYDRTIGTMRRREMFDEVDLHGMNERVDRGENFRDVIYETADANPEWRTEIRDWHDNWIALAQPAVEASVHLLRALRRARVPVFALSNFGVESFALAESQYPFLGEFDRRYISGHMKMTKPDPGIYRMVEDDCGIAPEALLFADDRQENLGVAATRGWQTHLFDGPRGWAARLVAEGLLSRDDTGL